MHICRPWQKYLQSLKKDPAKTIRGVAFTRYLVSKCFKPKNDYVRTAKKVTKIIWGLQQNVLHIFRPAKFQKDPAKTVGEVAFTRFCDGQTDRQTDARGNNLSLILLGRHKSQCMRLPTMWYVRPAKPQFSLRIHAVWSEPLLVAWVFYDC